MGEGIAISDTRTPVLLSVGISAYECGQDPTHWNHEFVLNVLKG